MTFLAKITPVVLTFNEAPNLFRTLSKLDWAEQVIVVDSGSTDETLRICAGFENVAVVTRPFDCHANQWNFAASLANEKRPWILALDADYVLSDALILEMAHLSPPENVTGYRVTFDFVVLGRVIRGGVYPPVTVLFRAGLAEFVQDGHTQRLRCSGSVIALRSRISHDDRKPLLAWLAAQNRYAVLEATMIASSPFSELSWSNRFRKLRWIMPWAVPVYILIVRGGLFDGESGVYYVLQRGIAEALIAINLIKLRHRSES